MVDGVAFQVYLSFTDYGKNTPGWKVPGVIHKPRTKGFTPSSVLFEDGTEVSDVQVVILASGYDYRFSLLDPSEPYNQFPQDIPTHDQRVVVTANASAHSRLEREPRLMENLRYLFPIDRQIVSLSSLHPLIALKFVGLPYRTAYAASNIGQSIFASHLISHHDRVYPTSRLTGREGWNETLVRELLLKNLTAFENRLADDGFDLYRIGHKMNFEWHRGRVPEFFDRVSSILRPRAPTQQRIHLYSTLEDSSKRQSV